jgi:hypothetical protein
LAGGSLSLRKNRYISPNCHMGKSGEGHPAHALHTRLQGQPTSLYIPAELVGKVEAAVKNRKNLQELAIEPGRTQKSLRLSSLESLLGPHLMIGTVLSVRPHLQGGSPPGFEQLGSNWGSHL